MRATDEPWTIGKEEYKKACGFDPIVPDLSPS